MNSSSKRILFIPCYNCEKQIERVLNKLALIEKYFHEILIVENYSTDQTFENIINFKKKHSKLKVIQHHQNYGLGGSFKSAIKYSIDHEIEYLYMIHGDDQGDIFDIEKMIKIEEENSVDCIFGARFMAKSYLENYSFIRKLGNYFFNMLFSVVLARPIYEIGSGVNCYRIKSLPDDLEYWPSHIAFDINLLIYFVRSKKNIFWHPIRWFELDQVSTTRNISVGVKVLTMLLRYLITRKLTYIEEKISREYTIYE